MRRSKISASLSGGLTLLVAGLASAGPVSDQFRSGAFGVPWNASKATIQAKHPGGDWDTNDNGVDRYCVNTRQPLLKLPPQHQTQQLCFLMGSDGTVASVTAKMDASLPALLAVVNRSRTMFGDFDSVRRDQSSIQARSTAMLWMKEKPYLVQVASENDASGKPIDVTFTVADEAAMYSGGAAQVSHQPAGE